MSPLFLFSADYRLERPANITHSWETRPQINKQNPIFCAILIISGIFSINNARVPLFLLQASKSLTVGFPWFLKVVLTRYRLLYGLVYPVLSHKSKLVDIKYSGLEFLAMSSRRNQVEQSARFKSVHGF